MAELATLARPYAGAVFAMAKQDQALDRWSRMLGFLAGAAADSKVKRLLDAPGMAELQRASRLAEICGDELDDQGRKFVEVLAVNKRLNLIAEVREQFEVLRAQEQQSLEVAVTSAYPLSESQSERLKTALQQRFDKTVNLTSEVDSSLIGGVVIRAGDTVIDGSLRGKLNKLGETLART